MHVDSTAYPRHPPDETLAAVLLSAKIPRCIRHGKNRLSPGRTETEGIAKLSRPFDPPGPHWSQTFQTRHMTRWIEQNPSSNTATATQPRWCGFGWNLKKKCDQIIPAHEKYFKRDGHRYMRAHLRKNANQKCQLYVKLVAKRPSCWYRTNLFYSTFSNEGYPFRRPRMISNVNISDRKLHWPHSLPFLNTHEKN